MRETKEKMKGEMKERLIYQGCTHQYLPEQLLRLPLVTFMCYVWMADAVLTCSPYPFEFLETMGRSHGWSNKENE